VNIVNDPVQDGISNPGISNMIVPFFHGELTGDEGRTDAVPFLDHFEKISGFILIEGGQPQIVRDEQMGFGEFLHERPATAVGASESDLIKELGEAQIKGSKPFPAGFLS
jgi:hypothetical protein